MKPQSGIDMNLEEAHEVLNLSPPVSDEDIKDAYRDLTKQYHPDASGGDTQDEWIRIKEARDTLLEADRKRRREDASSNEQRQQTREQAGSGTAQNSTTDSDTETPDEPERGYTRRHEDRDQRTRDVSGTEDQTSETPSDDSTNEPTAAADSDARFSHLQAFNDVLLAGSFSSIAITGAPLVTLGGFLCVLGLFLGTGLVAVAVWIISGVLAIGIGLLGTITGLSSSVVFDPILLSSSSIEWIFTYLFGICLVSIIIYASLIISHILFEDQDPVSSSPMYLAVAILGSLVGLALIHQFSSPTSITWIYITSFTFVFLSTLIGLSSVVVRQRLTGSAGDFSTGTLFVVSYVVLTALIDIGILMANNLISLKVDGYDGLVTTYLGVSLVADLLTYVFGSGESSESDLGELSSETVLFFDITTGSGLFEALFITLIAIPTAVFCLGLLVKGCWRIVH